MTYILKKTPEDFIVEEIINLKIDKGSYSYFLLEKKNKNTIDAINLIVKNLENKKINFSGTKDKIAITKQYISINNLDYPKRKNYDFGNIKLKYLGQGTERLNLGTHKQNKFKITVRNIEKFKSHKKYFPNLYGEQRFSTYNVKIGLSLIKKDYKKALELINKTNNYSNIQEVPKKILQIYVNSFQSMIWNKKVNELIKNKPIKEFIGKDHPLIGFDSNIDLLEYNITPRDFINRQFPFLTLEEQKRKIIAELIDLKYKFEKNILILEFTLDKGSYATVAVDYLINTQ